MSLDKKKQEEIVSGFQKLRSEQRYLASKLSELQVDLNEHKLVCDTLASVSGSRRCFRLIGDVLTERTVSEVRPAVADNVAKMTAFIESLEKQLADKGKEINAYVEKNNIRFGNQSQLNDMLQADNGEESKGKSDDSSKEKKGAGAGGTGVLVSTNQP